MLRLVSSKPRLQTSGTCISFNVFTTRATSFHAGGGGRAKLIEPKFFTKKLSFRWSNQVRQN